MPSDSAEPQLTAADITGNSGEPPTITWRGTTYKVAFPCPKSVRELENYAKEEAYQRLEELAADIRDAAGKSWQGSIAEVRDQLKKQIVNREYLFCEPLYLATFSSKARAGSQLWACLKIAGNELPWGDVDDMIRELPDRVELLMGELNRGFFTLAAKKIPGLRLPTTMTEKKPD